MLMLGPAQVLSQESIPIYALHKDYVSGNASVFMQKSGEKDFPS
jgi:hypothetical protein